MEVLNASRDEAELVIRSWLITAVDALALVFGTLANEKTYESRVTIIVYRLSADRTQAAGRHWISYAGQLVPHSVEQIFDTTSIGFKVLMGKFQSPYFTTSEVAEKPGQGQPRTGETDKQGKPSYRPFVTFRLNESAIISFDWPGELKEGDGYVQSAKRFSTLRLLPPSPRYLTIGQVRWPTRRPCRSWLPRQQWSK